MLPFCWVIAACQCYKLFNRGRLAVTLHYTEFQAILPPLKFQRCNMRNSPLQWTPQHALINYTASRHRIGVAVRQRVCLSVCLSVCPRAIISIFISYKSVHGRRQTGRPRNVRHVRNRPHLYSDECSWSPSPPPCLTPLT